MMNSITKFAILVSLVVAIWDVRVVSAGAEVCCTCEGKSMKPFVDKIKDQLHKHGAIQQKITIGQECCICDCDLTEEEFNVIVMVNKPGVCKKRKGGEEPEIQNGDFADWS